jgi:FkbM family methyltransferase
MVMLNTGLFAPVYRWLSKGSAEPMAELTAVPMVQPVAASLAPPSPLVAVHSLTMLLDTSEAIQGAMAAGVYEPEQTAWARECLAAGDRFVDVGANFGWYTALASTIVGPSGSVFAFEPSPVAAKVIARTIAENHLRNVKLVRAAVGAVSGHEHIYMPVNDVVHSPSAFRSDPAFVPLEVPVIPLDLYAPLADGRIIKLIKIDVEGYEPNVIRGMAELLRKGAVQNIFLEFNSGWLKRNATTPAELFDLVTSHGFQVHRKTALQVHPERNGDPFELQDIWFKWPG